ncbi:DUF2911 domain-containing protein [Flagellimonas nanhaiensis]|uniref:DUF2911 domain-containing protein n=1 Tax=Flagellimonas nanhaiensis TaxID=2292706 RepID=A0A371JL39_9FLAO|nr:DUF2911 domain-containing protein [Allomuricauda nanhaiensis]RDY57648.1 DUF2911 domain-containing protein [Allomuricauda nanhaiensis]
MFQRFLGFVLFLLVLGVNGQITHPKASPFSKIEQEVGLSKISVEYSRPAVRGREIFGNLVPYGRIWRVGANESTKITVSTDMEVMGNLLPKGTYALYAFPEAESWEMVFHTNTSHWGDGRKNYDPKEDLFRIKVTPMQISGHQENFLIAFDSITHNTTNMQLIWASTMVTIPFAVDTHGQMNAEIAKQLKENPSAQTYYEAARYLQEQGLDYERALGYLNKALEIGGDTYYFHKVKSLVEAALGDYESAIKSAGKSLEISKDLEKDEFVRMNQKNIEKWRLMLKK